MIPILFEYNATDFSTHGLGDLVDCVSCEAAMTDEGEWELSFRYPVTSELFPELTIGRLIWAKANHWQGNQLFRIYGYEKDIGGMITVNCQHISYDLSNIPVKAFKCDKNATAGTVLQYIRDSAVAVSGLNVSQFNLSTNVPGTAYTEKGYFELESPSTVRAALLGTNDSIKEKFGGDPVFDNRTVQLLNVGGADRGVVIEYGVDLMDLSQEENISEMYTGVLPYFSYSQLVGGSADDGEYEQTVAYGDIQYVSGSFRTHKIYPLDLTSYFPDQEEHTYPSASTLNAKAREWINAEKGFGEPEVNLTLSYASLGQDVRLYDAVTVKFVKMGISVKSKITSYKYDVLMERAVEVEVGKTKASSVFSLEDASRLKRGLLPPERIQNKSITNDKYQDGSVETSSLAGGAVTTGKIASDAVIEEKIKDDAVTEDKIKNAAVTVNKISNGSVITEKLADGAVMTDKLAEGAVNNAKLAALAVSEEKIMDRAISYAKMWSASAGGEGSFQVFWADLIATLAIFSDRAEFNRMVKSTNISGSNYWVNRGNSSYTMDMHTHYLDVVGDEIHIRSVAGRGSADWTGGDHFFKISATKKYKDDVAAAETRGYNRGYAAGWNAANTKIQTKTEWIYDNGVTYIYPNDGYLGMSYVKVYVDVPQGGFDRVYKVAGMNTSDMEVFIKVYQDGDLFDEYWVGWGDYFN